MGFIIGVASLNQWALDFEGNTKRIIESILEAESKGAIYRTGPELELSGYSLEDAFFEDDTTYHCWQSLSKILDRTRNLDIVCDIGMPVHFGSLYNCRVICYKGRILFIRAKTSLAREGLYREHRHFNAWPPSAGLVPYKIPALMLSTSQPEYVPFGADFVLDLSLKPTSPDSTLRIGWEICQELWDVKNVSADLYDKFGCHLVVNSSGSYWELRKLDTVSDMIKSISLRAGACYAFSNFFGCDGQRYVFSGRSLIYDRGNLKEIMDVNSNMLVSEKHLIFHEVNPSEINEHRAQWGIRPSIGQNDSNKVWNLLSQSQDYDSTKIDKSYKILQMTVDRSNKQLTPLKSGESFNIDSAKIKFKDEIHTYVPLWLWDYLRRSGMKGFMMPLSGGLDSCTVAMLVYALCNHLHKELHSQQGERQVNSLIGDYFQRVHCVDASKLRETLKTPEQICQRLLKCVYISTNYSSQATEMRARKLCESIGANYSQIPIQSIYEQCSQLNSATSNNNDEQLSTGQHQVSLLGQNLQARLRMVMTYFLSEGNRIVLATGNVDEGIMGYLTKYDCSSADINPIGGLCKEDLKSYLKHCCSLYTSNETLVMILESIIAAPPSAELTGAEQRDEDEIGLTYDEISVLGKVRRGVFGCSGPKGAFECVWRNRNSAPFSTKIRCLRDNVATNERYIAPRLGQLIKLFYGRYIRNRHKLTVLTPALHAETYSPDDNRFDHRQFLYPSMELQFACIDQMVEKIVANGDEEESKKNALVA